MKSIKISISVLLIIVSAYLLFQVRHNFIIGMNPYIGRALIAIPIVLLIISYLIVNTIQNKKLKLLLRMFIFVAFLAPFVFFFLQHSQNGYGDPSRRYLDSTGWKSFSK